MTAPIYKLVVGDRIEFDVKFTLNDGGEDKTFGMRLTARRQPLDEQQRDLQAMTTDQYLQARGVQLLAWTGKPGDAGISPLADEGGAPVPAGAEALNALYRLVSGMSSLVLVAYLKANGAQGLAGN